jgi:hypothetical protein
MKRTILATLFAGVLGFAGYAFAQVVNQPQTNVNQNDLVQIIKAGQGTAQSVYAPAGMVGGEVQYAYSVPVTAFTITPASNVWFVLLNPAGTLETGTLTMPANPGDGQKLCLMDSQTQTAITIAANTGQSLASYGVTTPTALVANTVYCWFYIKSQAAWVQTH